LRFLLFFLAFSSLHSMADVPFSDLTNLPYVPADGTYSYGDDILQFGEYWQAVPDADIDAPLVLLIHGGCWLNAFDLAHVRPLASALAKRGLAVFSIEYRRIGDPGGGWPGTLEDITAALNFAVTLKHPNIVTVGHSAGGHLALWLAASSDQPALKGAIGLAAISDLITYAEGSSSCEKATADLMGGMPDVVPDRYQQGSPLVLPTDKPTLLIHGDVDQLVSVRQSQRFIQQHPESHLAEQRDKGHFDMIDPRQKTPQLIKHQIDSWLAL
jgi:acetyl esterase/lipase